MRLRIHFDYSAIDDFLIGMNDLLIGINDFVIGINDRSDREQRFLGQDQRSL